ncbi:MAG: hypothetical protein AVDCRST_MAG34-1495 [uncultured Nocardioidaceae bacterium]|uniref:Uncharacterized protein n=1 Tax=uncultured Nocardioidaceae bacterium TaxID=253824 RepID=A0A6J4L2C1_9ACTN|nr:MAG: hypothetical protein AVDCRST_MAG34-1495 [uncultured Nocardioidaceae bacterium]
MVTKMTRKPPMHDDFPKVGPLRAAASSGSEVVHLARLVDDLPARQSLCGELVTVFWPNRLLMGNACGQCAGLALEDGSTFARDRHGALVNLQRTRPIPRCHSR